MGNNQVLLSPSEKQKIYELIETNQLKFSQVHRSLKQDYDFVSRVINLNPFFLLDADISIQKSKLLASKACRRNIEIFNKLPKEIKNDVDFVKKIAFANHQIILKQTTGKDEIKEEYLEDIPFLAQMLVAFPELFKLFPERILTDSNLILFMESNPNVYNYLDDKHKLKKKISLLHFLHSRHVQLLPNELQTDPSFFVYILENSAKCVEYLPFSDDFTDEIIEQICIKNENFIPTIYDLMNEIKPGWVEKTLKNESLMIKLALKRSENLKYFQFELDDKELAFKMMQNDGWGYRYLPNHFKKDKSIAIESVYSCPSSFMSLDSCFKADPEFVLDVLKRNGLLLQYCNRYFQRNYQFAEVALIQNRKAFQYLSEDLKENTALLMIRDVKIELLK
eukprot:gene4096-7384_t